MSAVSQFISITICIAMVYNEQQWGKMARKPIQPWPLPEWKLVRCWYWRCTVVTFSLHRIDNVNWRFLRITVLWWAASWPCREWRRRRRCFCGMIYDCRRLLHYLPADVWSTVLYLFGSTPHILQSAISFTHTATVFDSFSASNRIAHTVGCGGII